MRRQLCESQCIRSAAEIASQYWQPATIGLQVYFFSQALYRSSCLYMCGKEGRKEKEERKERKEERRETRRRRGKEGEERKERKEIKERNGRNKRRGRRE
jgi:hypothetical protein